ncbi:MAG: hypothetical protein PHY05_02125 [Methanothrix sp.]|nr:hypothetical protein [Methanothrix sp.]
MANQRHCFSISAPENFKHQRQALLALRPDRTCAPERERLLACEPAWQTAAVNRMALACERLLRRGPRALAKIVLFSSNLRGFAPSREPVISARLASQHDRSSGNPARPDDITQTRTARPDGGSHHKGTKTQRR